MRLLILIGGLLLSSCTNLSSQEEELMNAIERAVILSPPMKSLDAYGRYYRYAEPGNIAAVYLIPAPSSEPEGCSVMTENDMRDCTAEEVDELRQRAATEVPRELPAGARRWVDKATEIPEINDGGCQQVNILYDVATRRFLRLECNGEA